MMLKYECMEKVKSNDEEAAKPWIQRRTTVVLNAGQGHDMAIVGLESEARRGEIGQLEARQAR